MNGRAAKAVAGFTLIELMVGMLLGLIVIAGVISVFVANQKVYRTNTALGEVQDGARIAFELLTQDIREAGALGCGNNGQVANVLPESPDNGGTAWWADWNHALVGYGAGTPANPALAAGAGSGNQVPGTDSLMVIGASDIGWSVHAQSIAAETFTLNGSGDDLAPGDVMIVCDPWEAAIFRASSYLPGKNPVIGYASRSGGKTVNAAVDLRPFATAGGVPSTYVANSPVATLAAGVWYIGYNGEANGGTSLYLASVDTATGMVAAQEMVRGVSAMHITYNVRNAPGFAPASAVTDWTSVVAVQLSVSVQQASTANAGIGSNAATSDSAGASVVPAAIRRSYAITATVRNRVD